MKTTKTAKMTKAERIEALRQRVNSQFFYLRCLNGKNQMREKLVGTMGYSFEHASNYKPHIKGSQPDVITFVILNEKGKVQKDSYFISQIPRRTLNKINRTENCLNSYWINL